MNTGTSFILDARIVDTDFVFYSVLFTRQADRRTHRQTGKARIAAY